MNSILPPCCRGHLCVAACLLLLASPLIRAGDLTGRAVDAKTGAFVAHVAIVVSPSGAAATTNSEGVFRIPNLPAGNYTVIATSMDYDSATVPVAVGDSGEVTATLRLNAEVQKLSTFVVEGYREGRSKAMQQKRTAENVVDIISADAIGNLPDRNVAEALGRLPGVNLSLEQGEGRYVSIRGSEPNLNQVMMDGATMAAPGGSRLGRAVPLDTLGSGQISSIEVVKSVTPDMDANAIGGSINIKSRSAFDHQGSFLAGSLSGNRNGNVNKNDPAGQVTYTNTFGAENRWGLAVSASYDKRNYQNEWLQVGGWSQVAIGGNNIYVPNDFEIKPEWGYKERGGLNLNLEYRPDANTQFYFRPAISKTGNPETRYEIIYTPNTSASNITLTSPHSGTYTAGSRTERRVFHYRTDRDLDNYAAGFKKIIGAFTLEPMITYSHADENNPYTRDREFRTGSNKGGPINFDLGTGFVPQVWDVNPATDVPSNYALRRTRDDRGDTVESVYTGKTDLRWDSNDILGKPGYLKTGFKFLKRARTVDLESRRLVPAGAAWTLADTGAQLPSVPVYDGRFQSLFLPNIDAIDAFIASHPSQVTHDPVGESTNSIEDDYQINEYIYSGYGMGSVKINNLRLLAGVRWEKTSATIRAVREVTVGSAAPFRVPTSGVKDYNNLFPNVQAIYHLTDTLQLRAAFTQTIGRPAYEDSRTLAIFNYSPVVAPLNPQFPNTGSLTVGNPDLKPYGAHNYDVSLEWYPKKYGGVVSVAAFRKEISNPIYTYTETQRNVVYGGVGLDTLSATEKFNGTSGRISGIEFSIYQPFRFLPSPFNGFGVEANFTAITSSEVIPTRPGEDIPFFRQPNKIKNFTLFYEQGRFSGRVAYSYAGEQIYTLGSNLISDRYETARGQYDVQASYRLTEHYSITAAVRNLTRVPDEMSSGIKNLLQMSRLLDRDYKVSVNFNF
jgi:TonB-dependent receptor